MTTAQTRRRGGPRDRPRGMGLQPPLVRGREEFDVSATVAEVDFSLNIFSGVEFAERQTSRGRNYVSIAALARDSVLAQNGLQKGDIILSLDREPVENLDDIERLAAASTDTAEDGLLLYVQRGQETSYVRIR